MKQTEREREFFSFFLGDEPCAQMPNLSLEEIEYGINENTAMMQYSLDCGNKDDAAMFKRFRQELLELKREVIKNMKGQNNIVKEVLAS